MLGPRLVKGGPLVADGAGAKRVPRRAAEETHRRITSNEIDLDLDAGGTPAPDFAPCAQGGQGLLMQAPFFQERGIALEVGGQDRRVDGRDRAQGVEEYGIVEGGPAFHRRRQEVRRRQDLWTDLKDLVQMSVFDSEVQGCVTVAVGDHERLGGDGAGDETVETNKIPIRRHRVQVRPLGARPIEQELGRQDSRTEPEDLVQVVPQDGE